MHEGPPNTPEKGPESIPTAEEVESVFREFIGEKEFETTRQQEDEKGLYLWDIMISGEEEDAEYSYMRAGRYPEGQAAATAIHVTFLDKDGMSIGGHSIAKYINGEWRLAP